MSHLAELGRSVGMSDRRASEASRVPMAPVRIKLPPPPPPKPPKPKKFRFNPLIGRPAAKNPQWKNRVPEVDPVLTGGGSAAGGLEVRIVFSCGHVLELESGRQTERWAIRAARRLALGPCPACS